MVGGLRDEEEGAACICVLLVMQHAYEPHVANKLLPSYQGLGPASTPIQQSLSPSQKRHPTSQTRWEGYAEAALIERSLRQLRLPRHIEGFRPVLLGPWMPCWLAGSSTLCSRTNITVEVQELRGTAGYPVTIVPAMMRPVVRRQEDRHHHSLGQMSLSQAYP